MARVRERYQLEHGFVLYAGNIKPHKNLLRLIEAFADIRGTDFEELKLVIIGDEISKWPELRRAVHRHHLHKHVRFLGYVSDDTLAILYRLAAVFVFPSLYEGFGLPPLEAMACGAPVVTSNVSSLPEVTGHAAVLVNPHDTGSIVEGVRRVLTSPSLERSLRRQGPERARQFSWERSVTKTRDLYERVATGAWGRSRTLRESRHRPRLADRHARGRAGPGIAVPAVPAGRHLHARSRPGIGLPHHRVAPHHDVVRSTPAGSRRRLPPLPPAVSGGHRARGSRRLRAGHQFQPLRGQVSRGARPGLAHLLLPFPDALRLGPVRPVLRPGAGEPPGEPLAVPSAAGPAGPLGRGHRRARASLCGQFRVCCGPDPPIL